MGALCSLLYKTLLDEDQCQGA